MRILKLNSLYSSVSKIFNQNIYHLRNKKFYHGTKTNYKFLILQNYTKFYRRKFHTTSSNKALPPVKKVYHGTKTNYKFLILQNYTKFYRRKFHTTSSNKALPPVAWVFIRSILKVATILTGRALRFWWARLQPNEKQLVIDKIRENRSKIYLWCFASSGIVTFYYASHLVQDPITNRWKFMLFSDQQIVHIANLECEFILEKLKNKISRSGDQYETVLKISQRILKSNKHFPGTQKKWEVFVINDMDKKNAFVLPSGHIFIFTGMLKIVSNDDQLAVILAHEIAHALLNHSAEVISKTHFMELLMLLPIFIIWALLPDLVAFSSTLLVELISTVLFRLPMNRQMEVEADIVGLVMAARACYDPRQAVVFWNNMEHLGETEGTEWLSTHPRYKTRSEILQSRMPHALAIRDRHCAS